MYALVVKAANPIPPTATTATTATRPIIQCFPIFPNSPGTKNPRVSMSGELYAVGTCFHDVPYDWRESYGRLTAGRSCPARTLAHRGHDDGRLGPSSESDSRVRSWERARTSSAAAATSFVRMRSSARRTRERASSEVSRLRRSPSMRVISCRSLRTTAAAAVESGVQRGGSAADPKTGASRYPAAPGAEGPTPCIERPPRGTDGGEGPGPCSAGPDPPVGAYPAWTPLPGDADPAGSPGP